MLADEPPARRPLRRRRRHGDDRGADAGAPRCPSSRRPEWPSPRSRRRPRRDRSPRSAARAASRWSCCCPGVLYLVLFFLTPLVSLIITSFQAPVDGGDIGQYQAAFQWQNYTDVDRRVLAADHPRRSATRSSRRSCALLISYPLAYFIGVKVRRFPLLQNLLLTLVIAPFFISFLLRTLAWKQLLSDDSLVHHVAARRSRSCPPDAHLTGTPFSVDLRSDLQLHPVHDAAALLDARAAGHRGCSRPAATCTRRRSPRSARSPSRCRCPASSRARC